MTGGLLNTTSRLALVAVAASIFAVGANAADLGGNCCADLEERVTELEATAARKGNRQVSLTVYGQVNEMVMFWDDGHETNTYVGVNDDSRSRFGFKGKAKINKDWEAGYTIEIGVRTSRSDKWDANGPHGGELEIDLRKSNWHLASKTFGKFTVGREASAHAGIFEINLGRINSPYVDNVNNDFRVRTVGGGTSYKWDGLWSSRGYDAPEVSRSNGIRYDSPTFAGFKVSASWGEDDYWAAALRYAGEVGAFRVAAGVAYTRTNEKNGDHNKGCSEVNNEVDCEGWNVGASVMHSPTGIFLSGAYGQQTDNLRDAAKADDTDTNWVVTAGIEQKWISLGKTTLYGQYYKSENNNYALGNEGGANMWAIGLNQNIKAAAMDLYVAYYHWDADIKSGGVEVDTESFQAILTGAKIKF